MDLTAVQFTTPLDLSGLTELTRLDLSETNIADLSFLLTVPSFAAERGKALFFNETPAADPDRDRRLYMLSCLDPKRCAVETVQYLKGTHPDFRGPPGGTVRAPLGQRLAEAAPVAVEVRDGRMDAVNRGPVAIDDPYARARRIEGLRVQVRLLRGEAEEAQLPRRLRTRLDAYAEALGAPDPVYFALEAPLGMIRDSLADAYLMQGTDAGLLRGFRTLVTRHDELHPYLLARPEQQAAREAEVPELDPGATPEDLTARVGEALEVLADPQLGDLVTPQLLRTLKAVETLADTARDRLEDRPGLLRRGYIALGGTLQLMANAAAVHGWALGPGAALLATQLAPILQAVLRAFGG